MSDQRFKIYKSTTGTGLYILFSFNCERKNQTLEKQLLRFFVLINDKKTYANISSSIQTHLSQKVLLAIKNIINICRTRLHFILLFKIR